MNIFAYLFSQILTYKQMPTMGLSSLLAHKFSYQIYSHPIAKDLIDIFVILLAN